MTAVFILVMTTAAPSADPVAQPRPPPGTRPATRGFGRAEATGGLAAYISSAAGRKDRNSSLGRPGAVLSSRCQSLPVRSLPARSLPPSWRQDRNSNLGAHAVSGRCLWRLAALPARSLPPSCHSSLGAPQAPRRAVLAGWCLCRSAAPPAVPSRVLP
jgi:hypothetical protein